MSKAKLDKRPLQIRAFFETLYGVWGPQHWWPAESPFEVIVGAILTQNTAWTNVEKALANLRANRALSVNAIRKLSIGELERMIQPAGFFRQKSARLKQFVTWLDARFEGSLEKMFQTDTAQLRTELLELNGIGPETADSILLYGGQHEVFVVDAYTRRIFERHGLGKAKTKYDEIRMEVEAALKMAAEVRSPRPKARPSEAVEAGPGPAEEVLTPVVHPPSRMSEADRSDLARRYNEFHALLVQVAKHYCQSRVARCDGCPLRVFLASGQPVLSSNGKTQ